MCPKIHKIGMQSPSQENSFLLPLDAKLKNRRAERKFFGSFTIPEKAGHRADAIRKMEYEALLQVFSSSI